MARTDGFVQMPSFLDVAPSSAPGLHLSHHALRRRASSSSSSAAAASWGHVIAGNRYGSSSAGCRWFDVDPHVLATAMMVVNFDAIKDGNIISRLPICASHPPPPPPPPPSLWKANAIRVRGGSATGRVRGNRRRARRPLRSFFAPALVWIIAACIDSDLWWGQGTAAAAAALSASPLESITRLRFGRGSVAEIFADNAAAYRGHFVCFHVLLGLTLFSHVAVTVTDPGFLPRENRVPGFVQTREPGRRWCGHCEGYKPPRAHHCRRCGACVARMDHHCHFVANCIGMGNHKQFILLLLYSTALAAYTGFFYFRLLFGRGSRSGDVTSGSENISKGLRCLASTASAMRPMITLLIFAWLAVLLTVQLYGIGVDAGIVDRLQASAKEECLAEKVGIPSTAAVGSQRRERWQGWPQVAPLASGSSPFPDASRGVGFGQLHAASNSEEDSSDRTDRRVEAFETAASLPRGPSDRVASDGDAGSEPLRTACCFIRKFWRTLRQEILGEGPWIMWFVPTPAIL